MKSERFTGVIRTGHKGDAVEVPFDPLAKWDVSVQQIRPGRRGYAVTCRIARARFDSYVVARSKKHWLLLPPEFAANGAYKAGDVIVVYIQPATTTSNTGA